MRFGLQVPRFETPGGPDQIGPAFARLATRAERSGFDSLWVMDHFFQLPMLGPAEQHMLDGTPALICGLAHLVAFKRLSDRTSDRADLEELERILQRPLPRLALPGIDDELDAQ